MVYCINCGTQLPDGAKFCMKCGTRLPDLNAGSVAPQKPTPRKAATPVAGNVAPQKPNSVKAAKSVAETVYVGKTGESLYVPGQGLYFIWEHERVYFLADFLSGGTHELKELWRVNEKYASIHTLGYHAGQLFFWLWRDSEDENMSGHFLYSFNISALQVRTVFKAKDFRFSEVGDDSAFYQGAYYVHDRYKNETGEIIKLDLNSGKITRKPMPDFKSMPIPEDWIKNGNGLMRPGLLNAQLTDRFMVLSGYGYRSFSYGGRPAIRFSLENPADFTFMPLFTGSTADISMLTQEKDTIYSYLLNSKGDPTHFYATRMSGNQALENRVLLDGESMEKYGLHTAQGWWRRGSKLYLYGGHDGGLLFDMEKEKFLRVKRDMYASDFVEDGRGMTYVFRNSRLYILPPNWMEIGQENLDNVFSVELPES